MTPEEMIDYLSECGERHFFDDADGVMGWFEWTISPENGELRVMHEGTEDDGTLKPEIVHRWKLTFID